MAGHTSGAGSAYPSTSGNSNQQHVNHHLHQHHHQQQQQNHGNSNSNSNNNEPDGGIGEWNPIEHVAAPAGGASGGNGGGGGNNHNHHHNSPAAGGNARENNNAGSNNNNVANQNNNQNAEEIDRFSFEDSDRFEEDSLCSWSSEPESVCNNWRGWKKPAGMINSFGGGSGRRFNEGEPTSLTELSARCVAFYIPFELVEQMYPPVPEPIMLRIAFWSFPDNEEDIRLYSCLANSSADEFHRGELLFKNRAVKDPLQIGFHLSATVVQTQPRNQYNVAVTFDRRKISSCSCTCLPTTYWCSHVVAVCLYRIHCPTKVSLRAPVSESLSRLQREQLQKFAQYLISEQSQQILPIAQRLLDELLSSQPTTINTVYGAPDPTAGASVNDQTNWYLDEKTLHDNIKKILFKFCQPTPMVFSDVNYLTNSAPPAAAEWSSLLRPLRGREPEGMWNLLSIVREMYRRCDRNAVRLLEIITEEVMACDQILVWWFNIKLALLVGSNGHGGGGGGGGGGKHGNTHSNLNATQHACASLCDEIVVLWRLAALNPGLAPDERDMLHAQFTTWHLKILDRVAKNMVASSSHSSKQQQNLRNDAELFAGFKPAIEACYLDWEDYPIEGVTHTQDTNPMYHCPFTCFKQNSDTRVDTTVPTQVTSTAPMSMMSQGNVKQFQMMVHHYHHHHSYHADYPQPQRNLGSMPSTSSISTGLAGGSTDRYRNITTVATSSTRTVEQQPHQHHGGPGPSGMVSASVAPTAATSNVSTDTVTNVGGSDSMESSGHGAGGGTAGDYDPAIDDNSAGSNSKRTGVGDVGSKNHHHRSRAHRDRLTYCSSSNNSSSDSVPDRLHQSTGDAGAKDGDTGKGHGTAMPGTSASIAKLDGASRTGSVGARNVGVRCDTIGAGGNRSSVSSEGFCENEDDEDARAVVTDEKLQHYLQLPVDVVKKNDEEEGNALPISSANVGELSGTGTVGTADPNLPLLSVSNSSSSSSSSSTSLSSSSATTDLLQKKKVAAEGTGSLSSESSNENSILNDMNNYEISGNIKLYEVLNMVESTSTGKSDHATHHHQTTKHNSAKRHGASDVSSDNASNAGAASSVEVSAASPADGLITGAQQLPQPSTSSQQANVASQQQQQQQKASKQQQHQSVAAAQLHGGTSDTKQQQQMFSNIKPTEDAWDILFARAEGLHAHGHGREACTLGVRLASEMLANPPNLMIDLPPPPKKKGKKHNVNPISHQLSVLASATLSKCAFLCTVLAENSEHYHLAFRVCLFGLEMSRPPASTKPLEVKLANQESDLLALLKRIPLGNDELKAIRDRAEQLRDGTLKSRGEALLPIMLASFLFDALVMPSVVGRENRLKMMSSVCRYPTDENLGFEAAVAALGLKANVSEAEHPLLCEGTRRQRGDLALTLLSYYKDEPRKICRIMEKLLDREIHVLIKTPLLPSYYSNNPPTRSQTSQLRLDEYEAGNNNGGGSNSHHHPHQLQPYGGHGGGRSSSSTGSAELQQQPAGSVAASHLSQGSEFGLANSSRPQSSTSAELEAGIGALTLGGGGVPTTNGSSSGTSSSTTTATTTTTTAATSAGNVGSAMMAGTAATAGSNSANAAGGPSTSSAAPVTTGATTSSVTSTRSKDSRYKGKRAYPSIPNQPSEASAHFMFELAKNVLTKAGGTSATSLFTQATTTQNHQGPHRGLHMCAFQLGLYALGLHNCVSPNWLSRTYSSHVSWIIGQAMDIGAPAISFLIDTWEGHLTPPEAAGMADRASSRGWDSNMVNPAAELALSVLPHAAALNPNEIQRAILQCKEQSDRMLERACIMVETAAKGGGVYPEVLFQVSRYWYELYLRNTPGGEMEPEEQHDVVVNLMQLMEPGADGGVLGAPIAGVPTQPGGNGPGAGGVPPPVGGGNTPQQPYPPHQHQPVSGLAPIGMTPYGGYGYGAAIYHHQNTLQYAHPTNAVHQMYMATPLQFQYPPPPPPGGQGGQSQQPQPPAVGYGQQQQPPQQPLGSINPAAVAAYQSMQQHGVPPQAYGTPPQYQAVPGVPVQTQGPPTNPGQMGPNMQQFYGGSQAAVAAAMQHQQQLPGVPPVQVGGPQGPPPLAPSMPPAVAGNQQPGGVSCPMGPGGPQGPAPVQQVPAGMPVVGPGGSSMRPQHAVGVGGPPYGAAYGPAAVTGGSGTGIQPLPPQSATANSSGQVARARHPHHSNTAQLRYLLATYNAGMLALETLARRVHDDRPQAKYARNPPYGEDVKWLLRISKKLGTQYLHQFCVCVVNSIVSPFVLHEVAIESAHYLSRNNPALVMHHLRSALTPLMSKCQSMYFQCIHQKLYHLTIADYEDFTSTILSARNAFQITPEGNAQFKDWLQSIKRSKSCKKELWTQINAALNSK